MLCLQYNIIFPNYRGRINANANDQFYLEQLLGELTECGHRVSYQRYVEEVLITFHY